jgi:hypothetical protein
MAKVGPIGSATMRYKPMKGTKREPNKPNRKRKKAYRGQGRA